LFFAGRDGAPDAYEQPFDSLDFVYSFYPTERLSMKFRVQNLLDEELEITQNDTCWVTKLLLLKQHLKQWKKNQSATSLYKKKA
jgi:hypothetical protein